MFRKFVSFVMVVSFIVSIPATSSVYAASKSQKANNTGTDVEAQAFTDTEIEKLTAEAHQVSENTEARVPGNEGDAFIGFLAGFGLIVLLASAAGSS